MKLGLREANQQFSKAIRAVKAGREVVLTERGRPIAIIRPLARQEGINATLRRLAAAGLLRLATRSGPLPPWKPRPIRGAPITQTLREERDAD
jgi:prevent-host-death family protein